MKPRTPLQDAALFYAKLGWPVIPLHHVQGDRCSCGKRDCGSPGKHPRTKDGLKDGSKDKATIAAWWRRWPQANVGICTGAEAGIVVIDIDPRHGGNKSLAALTGRHSELPATVEGETGGGGRHLVFHHPGCMIRNRAKVRPGIDVRGDGGYIVAPSSNHASGGQYRWREGRAPGEIAPAELPAWLLELITAGSAADRQKDRSPPDNDGRQCLIEAAQRYVAKVRGVAEGDRNTTAFNLGGHLAAFTVEGTGAKLAEVEIVDLLRPWNLRNDPPLGGAELKQAIASGLTNGQPREPHVVKMPRRETANGGGDAPVKVDDPWPEPIDTAAMHGLAGDVVAAIEPHSEADPVALLVQFLVAFGNVIGRGAYFMAENDWHRGNLFACLVGITSKGRKGVAWGQASRPFAEVDAQWRDDRVMGGLSSGEGLIWAVRDPITKREAVREGKGRNAQIVDYQDVVVDDGVEDKRLLVLEAEFSSVLKVVDRERNTLSAIIRQAWDSGMLRSMTKNSPAKATGAHISIVGHITRDELRRLITQTDLANGLANRFLWLCVQRSKFLPEGGRLRDSELDGLVEHLRAAVDFATADRELRRDEAARAVWCDVYPTLSAGRPGLLGAATSRAEAQVMRLALVYALLDCSHVIRPAHLMAGLSVWTYCEQSARYIFGSALGDPTADEILTELRRRHPKGMTRSEIRELFHRNKPSKEINRALSVLLEYHLARPGKRDTAGRPAEVWFAVQ